LQARVIACDITVPRKNLRETLEQAAAAWAGDLAANCETGNFAQLLRHLIQLLARCTSGDHARVPEEDVTGALNVVLLVRVAAKNHVEQLPEDRLGHLYGAFKPAWERQGDSGDVLLDAVCDALCLLLMSESHQPHTYFTYALQADAPSLHQNQTRCIADRICLRLDGAGACSARGSAARAGRVHEAGDGSVRHAARAPGRHAPASFPGSTDVTKVRSATRPRRGVTLYCPAALFA